MEKAFFSLFKFVIVLLSFNGSLSVTAQKTGGTVPKRADLAITEFKLIEATRNPATDLHKIKVQVTIKNNGDAPSGTTSLKMLIQNHVLNLVAPPNQQPNNPWHQLGDNQPVNDIAPGKISTVEYFFTESRKVITTSRFNIGVMADAENQLKEINETDNRSAEIKNVDPIDKTEYVAVTPTIRTTQQLVRKDTLVHSIGRADFKITTSDAVAAPDITEAFVLMGPKGVTLKRLGIEANYKITAGMSAPLHLPAGASIHKIVFNYMLLPGHSAVPHLVLRSHFLTADKNEGWGSNTHLTPFWVSSESPNGTNGYQVKFSKTDPGFNVIINEKATYYFEVLADESRSRGIPQTSRWPNDERMFIWSIQVYYTLN
jgi:CARDB